MNIENIVDLKNKNMKSIIDYMRFQDYVVKKQIASELNLSFATVSNMTNYLKSIDLIREADSDSALGVGRAPKNFIFNASRFTVLVMDLHLPNRVMLYEIDLARNILHQKLYPNFERENTTRYFDDLSHMFHSFVAEFSVSLDDVIGVGAAIPGMYDREKEVVAGTINAVFSGQPVRRLLEQMTGKPVTLDNDANLAATFASCTTCVKDLVYIYLDMGIGIGVVTNGHILRSVNGYSSEIAHAPLGNRSHKCPYCGNRDCLQTDLSRDGYLSKYYQTESGYQCTEDSAWLDFIRSVDEKDEQAMRVMEENTAILSRALATITILVRPKTIVVGGLPKSLSDYTLPICENSINSRKYYNPYINILCDSDVQKTIAKGAAEVVYSKWHISV